MKTVPSRSKRLLAAALTLSLFAAACGDDDDDEGAADDEATTETTQPATETTQAAPATTQAATETTQAAPATTQAAPMTTQPAEPAEPIQIGALMELTGPGAALGVPESEGLELAVDMINDAGGVNGRQIELTIRDAESLPDRAVELAQQFISDEVDVVIGPSLAAGCNAVRPLTVEAEIVHYCLSGAPFEWNDPYFFAAFEKSDGSLGESPAIWMETQGFDEAACIATTDQSGDAYTGLFTQSAEARGITVKSERFAPGDTSVETQLTNVRSDSLDVIYSCASGANLIPVVSSVVALGMDQPVYAGAGSVALAAAAAIKDSLPSGGVYSVGAWMLVPEEIPAEIESRDSIVAFIEAYEERFGKRAEATAGAAYDVIQMLAMAFESDPADGAELGAALESIQDYHGLYAIYNLGPDDHRGATTQGVIVQFNEEGTF